MKRVIRVFVLFLLIGMFVVLAGFLALAAYYRSHFPVNTWINGVYCTGKTVEQVNQELVGQASAPVMGRQLASGRIIRKPYRYTCNRIPRFSG